MKTGKTKTRVHTHPDMHAPPPISIHTHTHSLFSFFLSCYVHSVLPLCFFLSRGLSAAVTLCPLSLSLCDQWGCLHSAGSTPSLKFNINPPTPSPPDSTMKAGRAGRGRMSHPRVHSPQKKPSCDFFFFACEKL